MNSSENVISKKTEQPETIFGHCFELKKIENGDLIPVGGENQFAQDADIHVLADFDNLIDWFEKMQSRKDKIMNVGGVMAWAESKGLDRNVFSSVAAFTKTFGEVYASNPKPELSRQDLYLQKGKDAKLSDVFKGGVAECAEISAIAQYELQQQGIESSYFSGDVLCSKDEEFSEEHSFIVIKQGDRTIIFDPTNPSNTPDGPFPSIYIFEGDFDQEVRNGKKRFITAKNVLSGKEVYFGVNNGTNVSENDIS